MATGRPTVICVTSGTAAAELHPAVVEAHHARVPLIVCTADRPPELHHTGAPQSIEQNGPVRHRDPLGVRAGRARRGPGGHLETARGPCLRGGGARDRRSRARCTSTCEFREPLTGVAASLPGVAPVRRWSFRRRESGRTEPDGHARVGAPPGPWADHRGWPVVAAGGPRPRPGTRRPTRAGRSWPTLCRAGRLEGTIAAADAIVRTEPPLPECIVLLGAPWLSRALGTFVSDAARAGARIVVVDPVAPVGRSVTGGDRVPPVRSRRLARRPPPSTAVPSRSGRGSTRGGEREAAAQAAIAEVLGTDLSEPLVARSVHRYAAETGATLVVAASMPIRDLEWYAEAAPDAAAGLAQPGRQRDRRRRVDRAGRCRVRGADRVRAPIALLGDLTFLHDVSGLGQPRRSPVHVRRARQRRGRDLLLPAAGDLRGAGRVRAALRHAPDQ